MRRADARIVSGPGVITSAIGRSRACVAALLEQPGQVAVGEQAAQSAVGVGQHDRAGASAAAPDCGETSRTVVVLPRRGAARRRWRITASTLSSLRPRLPAG